MNVTQEEVSSRPSVLQKCRVTRFTKVCPEVLAATNTIGGAVFWTSSSSLDNLLPWSEARGLVFKEPRLRPEFDKGTCSRGHRVLADQEAAD